MTFSKIFKVERFGLIDRIKAKLESQPFTLRHENILEAMPEHHHEPAKQLNKRLAKHSQGTKVATMYYPGSGMDLAWPLLILDAVASDATKWTIITQDLSDTSGALISTIQSASGNKVFTTRRHKKESATTYRFIFKDKTIEIQHHTSDALSEIPINAIDGYDIYFERGFDIMRQQRPGFIHDAIKHLCEGGIAITDCEFYDIPKGLKKSKTKLPKFGLYDKATLYTKKIG